MDVKIQRATTAKNSARFFSPTATPLLLISRVTCGGRRLTLVKTVSAEILPLVVRKFIALKRPYLHYRICTTAKKPLEGHRAGSP